MEQDRKDQADMLTTGHDDHDRASRGADGRGASEGGGTMSGGVSDDLEGGTTGSTSMTGGDRADPSDSSKPALFGQEGRDEAAPGGRWNQGASEADLGPIGMESAAGSPTGEGGGDIERGPAANGSFASGTYNDRGNMTGADSPAGADVAPDAGGEGQGDDLANRLGGVEARGAGMSGGGAATGDMSADRSEADGANAQNIAGTGGTDAGSPGGMGGVHARSGATGTGRPPGGVSPIQIEEDLKNS